MLSNWLHLLNQPRFPINPNWIGETPLVASRALIAALDDRIHDLLGWLKPRLGRQDDSDWPMAPAADVLSADLAIVRAPDTERGWDLRWVELQTFTSLVSLIYTLHRAGAELWPELAPCTFWGKPPHGRDWLSATKTWMAPAPDSILLEHNPWSQPTRADFEAARHWFGLTVTEPQALRPRAGRLERIDESGRLFAVPHIANRLILHEAENAEALTRMLSSASVSWHSHPVWYYRINKGVMPDLPLPQSQRCARGDRWRELGHPAEALVAKACRSYAGKSVLLTPDAKALDSLDDPQSWIVQPRFSSAPLIQAHDGAPLHGEIRCVIALPRDGADPWIVCRLARMTRGPMASANGWSGLPGEGAVPVYAPPA
ncbi:MAG: hypothetical protein ACTHLR_11740 [Rhizomicrobium sp.]